MKKSLIAAFLGATFLSAAAFAADMPPAMPYKAAPAYSWSGFYAGIHGGYGWGDNDVFDTALGAGAVYPLRPRGGFGGLQIGYNSQFAPNWLIGGEIDSSWGDISDTRIDPAFPGTGRGKFDYFGSARTRFGYVQDRSLLYITGGVAWAHDKFTDVFAGAAVTNASHYLVGWTLGGGWEYAFDPRWSFKIEYLYASFNDNIDRSGGGFNRSFDANLSTVRAGLNYRFGDTSSSAGYMPVKAAAPRSSWNGGYLGVHGGYGWGDYRAISHGGPLPSIDPDGGFGGFQSGANWQFAPNWLFGLETDGSFGDLKGSNNAGNIFRTKIDGFGTARARFGYVANDTLWYVTAGGAYAREKSVAFATPSKEDHFGWTVGGGVEWKFAPEWSAKLEYLYADLGENKFDDPVALVTRRTDLTVNTVRIGLNYYGPVIERLFGAR